ncbi:MAG TPA: CerR family C-terminal domain-containing protein [Geobacteraceae bacterium]|nr:CerR family C-terminal domain-containing protein [Geobacteraceae bacterium]
MGVENVETRLRILETAALVFAERGFAATTVRMICGRANVNIAAVNYHFGGKEALYREVLRYVRSRAYEKYPITYGLAANPSPDARLHAFVHSFLLRALGDEWAVGFGTLTMREMVEPTGALDMIVDEGIRSMFQQLMDIVAAILGKEADDELVQSCSRSIIGQCVFYMFSRSVITRMAPEQKFDEEALKTFAGHIVDFSMNALRGMRSQTKKKSRT